MELCLKKPTQSPETKPTNPTHNMTETERKNYVDAVTQIALAIRAKGKIPSGHLYASLMGTMGLVTYQGILETLKKAGLINVNASHEIIYMGNI